MGDTESDIPVTVVLRSYNDAALLPRTLEALDAQTTRRKVTNQFKPLSLQCDTF